MAEIKKTAAIDFDGVIHEYYGWTGNEANNKLIKGVRRALHLLKKNGYNIIVFSTRKRKFIYDFLVQHSLNIFISDVIDGKPFYDVFFDDRAINIKSNKPYSLYKRVRRYLKIDSSD